MKIDFDLKAFLQTLPEKPGVYRMYDREHVLLYVGKAASLKKRVNSYFKSMHSSIKTEQLVTQIVSIEITITQSEVEA